MERVAIVRDCVKASPATNFFTGVRNWCVRNGKIIGLQKKEALFTFKLPKTIAVPPVEPVLIRTRLEHRLAIKGPNISYFPAENGYRFFIFEGGNPVESTFTRAETNAWEHYNKDLRAHRDGQVRW